jgi:L-fuculose-phosphate aldolase
LKLKVGKEVTEDLKKQIVQTGRDMAAAAMMVGHWGNISARIHGTDIVVITPSGFKKGELKTEDIIVLETGGKILEGEHKPSVETAMHLTIYEKKPEVDAIVHTHSPMATAIGIAGIGIPIITVELLFIVGGDVPLAKYRPAGSKILGDAVVKALKNTNACLMQNHGVIAVGPNLSLALYRAMIVEDSAKLFIYANSLGKVRVITPSELKTAREIGSKWRALKKVKDIKKEWLDKLPA